MELGSFTAKSMSLGMVLEEITSEEAIVDKYMAEEALVGEGTFEGAIVDKDITEEALVMKIHLKGLSFIKIQLKGISSIQIRLKSPLQDGDDTGCSDETIWILFSSIGPPEAGRTCRAPPGPKSVVRLLMRNSMAVYLDFRDWWV